MNWHGKFLGILIAALLGLGLLGMVIGFIIGHLFDIQFFHRWLTPVKSHFQQVSVQKIFFQITFMIMGYLSKVDGRVSEKEIITARNIMHQMGLNEELRHQAMLLFNKGKQLNFNWRLEMKRFRQICHFQSNLLRTFIEIQLQIVFAEGSLTPRKYEALKEICLELGLSQFILDQYLSQTRAQQDYQSHHKTTQEYTETQQLSDAYQVLGVSSSITNSELTKTYRRLMSKHHPDKLVAQGLPPEMIKLMTEKTQKIKSAYEFIKKHRGM